MEKKTYNTGLNLKAIDSTGCFSGYASVFDVEDNHGDVIFAGAFTNSLLEKDFSKEVKLLWQHNANEPIGIFTKIYEDDYGLYVEGKLLLEVERAREAYSLLQNGAVQGLSIGFIVNDFDYAEDGTRIIYEADLWEVSLVTFPANEKAVITEVKSDISLSDNFSHLYDSIENTIRILRS